MDLFLESDGRLAPIGKTSGTRAGRSEREIQSMVERNLPLIFPGMEVVSREYPVGRGRIDTLAFDRGRMAFAVIEYKNVKKDGAIEQGVSYRSWLREDAYRAVNECNKRGMRLDADDVDWDRTRLIFIAPRFDARQVTMAKTRFVGGPVTELYRISTHEGGIVGLERVCDCGEQQPGVRGPPRARRRGGPGPGGAGRASSARPPRGGADPSRVSEVVAGCLQPGRPVALADMYRAVDKAGLGSGRRTKDAVRGVISHMRGKGQVRSVSRGVWQAVRLAAPGAGGRGTGRGTRAGGRRATGMTGAVMDFLSAGGPKTLAEIYGAVAAAGHGDGKAARHNVRGILYHMGLKGRVRRVSPGVYRSA